MIANGSPTTVKSKKEYVCPVPSSSRDDTTNALPGPPIRVIPPPITAPVAIGRSNLLLLIFTLLLIFKTIGRRIAATAVFDKNAENPVVNAIVAVIKIRSLPLKRYKVSPILLEILVF